MLHEIIIAGYGGQGILFAGQLLAYSAMLEEKYVTFFPSYGAEIRGGTANCTVVISDEEIGSPVISHPSEAIIMNRPSLDRFEPKIKTDGFLLLNTSLIKQKLIRSDIHLVETASTEIAEELGNAKVANLVALGAYIKAKNPVSLESVIKSLPQLLLRKKENLIEINTRALERGFSSQSQGEKK